MRVLMRVLVVLGFMGLTACASQLNHSTLSKQTPQPTDRHCQRHFVQPKFDPHNRHEYEQKMSEYHTNTSLCQSTNSFSF
ncbi:MAG: hypothetical protein Q4B81_00420 [Moraxella sp.]|nr:hypothetical protein [Moraxella sp.]